jgi:AraC-like DNA-binding protein
MNPRSWLEEVEASGVWRDPQLTLARLADRTHTSPSWISRAVNRGVGQNVNEAINRMRVRYVEDRLRDPSDARDPLVIALESGFSSKASFYRCFKQFTGTTPFAYRQRELALAVRVSSSPSKAT